MELLNRFCFLNFFHMSRSPGQLFLRRAGGKCFWIVISNDSWQHYFVLFDMYFSLFMLNDIILSKEFRQKCFKFYGPAPYPVLPLMLWRNLKIFCRFSLGNVSFLIQIWYPGQNIWNKIEKSCRTGQHKKSFISTFACFLIAIAKV